MPFRKSKSRSTRRPRRRPVRRAGFRRAAPRVRMPLAPTGSFASRSETYTLSTTAGQVYDLNSISLNSLSVAPKLANLYQYYRITSIQWRLKPNFDTFTQGGGSSLPYLYFLYDKSGSLGMITSTQFAACGAKPQRVDDKTLVRSWKPSVRISGDNASVPMFKTSPWMPTHDITGVNLNAPPHMGCIWYVQKTDSTDAQTYLIDITVNVQFRKPLVLPSQ